MSSKTTQLKKILKAAGCTNKSTGKISVTMYAIAPGSTTKVARAFVDLLAKDQKAAIYEQADGITIMDIPATNTSIIYLK